MMFKDFAYSSSGSRWRMHVFYKRMRILSLVALLFVLPVNAFSQDEIMYDEIMVLFNIRGIGTGEIPAVIEGEELFLPVGDLFDFIKIKNSVSPGFDTISGFFITQDNPFLIDRVNNIISYQNKDYRLNEGDLVRTETGLYLKTRWLGEVFDLDCKFSFRSLSVAIESRLELPAIREIRIEEMRRNINRLKGEFIADTAIGRSYPMFHFGMADWSVVSTQKSDGNSDARLNLSLGSVIAKGEMTATFNYNTNEPFNEKQQFYRWRYVDNNRTALRQVIAGKITTQATSSIYNPVIGVQLTNTPTTYRKSFGTYTLSDRTEPGWIVELYVNNVLVDYTKADATGFYKFDVPLIYGNSVITEKFYGPWGEERSKEHNISIPFTLLPEKTFEYTTSAGIVEDSLHTVFARGSAGYGLSRSITVGGGLEFLSSLPNSGAMPFVNATAKLSPNMLLSGEYTYGVRTKASFSYRMPSNIQLSLNYVLYDKEQKAINNKYREERKLLLFVPFTRGKFSFFNRLSINQIVLKNSNYTTGEWTISVPYKAFNTNVSTYALFIGSNTPNIYSNLAVSTRLPARMTLTPQVQYSYTLNQLISAKLKLEKRFSVSGYAYISYEQNFRNDLKLAELGVQYDFAFAQAGASIRRTNESNSFTQYVRGSLINDRPTKFFGARRNLNVGRGGISVVPFLDYNANGVKDKGEQKIAGLNLHASVGRLERSERDTTIRILGLEPYTTCYLELDPYSFDNISWKIKNVTYSVEIDPNIMKLIEVPVTVVGEASGTIMLEENEQTEGLGRIIVNFYSQSGKQICRTLSEMDGYYSYLGFEPGPYTVRVDTAQLRKLRMKAIPESINFDISKDLYGDYVDGLDFTLFRIKPDTTIVLKDTIQVIDGDTVKVKVRDTSGELKQIVRQDTTVMIIHEVTKEVVTTDIDKFAIQIGAFKRKSNAEALKKRLSAVIDKNIEIISEDGFYKVRVTGFESKEELNSYIPVLKRQGVTEMWIVNTVVKKQDVMVTELQDTVRKVVNITETEEISRIPSSSLGIQVGAFREKRWATNLKNKTKGLTDKKVTMEYEDGFYKVRIAGIANVKEMEEMMPMLFANGYKDVWILPYNEKIEMPYNAASIRQMIKLELAPVANSVPTVALQVGAFYKKHEAVAAARKIANGTGRKTVVKKQWDYYTVFVTGFYTKEETYKYYPEIAGLGFPQIYLIGYYVEK